MKFFFRLLSSILPKLLVFALIFVSAQFTRELLVRPLIVHTVGPFKIEKHLYVDESFNLEETMLIVSAAKEWEKKTNGIVTFRVSLFTTAGNYLTLKDSKAIAITKMSPYDSFIEDVEDEQGKILGVRTKRFPIEIVVIVPDRMKGDYLEFNSTTLHELGHSLGMQHNLTKWTLMYPSDEFGAYSITNEDLKQFCLIYFCDAKKLSH
jgi:predicted Zn-dependent protease